METPLTPPISDRPASIPGEPFAPTTGRLASASLSDSTTETPAVDPPPRAAEWAPPAPTPVPSSTRSRARFGAGVLVGIALTGAAVGGYAIGQESSTPDASVAASSATVPAVPAEPVSAATGSIADLVDDVRPSVVSVRQEVGQPGAFGRTGQSAGTGFVLSADGYIVTNNHVVAGGGDTVVTFADGTVEPATIVAGDASRDLAVLRVDRTDLLPLAVGDSSELRLGDQLIAVGYALDLNGEPSVTSGILSAKNRTITAENGVQLVNLLQTDTAINPGNSGGPLLNADGEVVGINTAIAGGAENIGFAIAITPVMDVIDDLQEGTVPDRALMGVTTQPTGEGLGVEIVDIADGSGADASSLRIGDVIVAVDDADITDPTSLGAAIATYQPGDAVTVTVERGGTTQDVTVTLGVRPT